MQDWMSYIQMQICFWCDSIAFVMFVVLKEAFVIIWELNMLNLSVSLAFFRFGCCHAAC